MSTATRVTSSTQRFRIRSPCNADTSPNLAPHHSRWPGTRGHELERRLRPAPDSPPALMYAVMVESAQKYQILQNRRSAEFPRPDVMCVAPFGRTDASRKPAPPIASDQVPADRREDGLRRGSHPQ